MELLFYYIFLFFVIVFIVILKDADLSIWKSPKYIAPLDVNIHSILIKNFHFYKMLTPLERPRFVFRVKKFLIHKNFVGQNDLTVTDEMRILMSATAVQLTFGFTPIILKYFHTILIYPEKYYSKRTGTNHVGEVSNRGLIKLSWPHFLKTLKNYDNGYNLGLHEMSHALKLENAIRNGEYGFMSTILLGRLHRLSLMEIRKIRRGENQFLRKYAASNQEEFFAVSVEYFFEKPLQLQKQLPQLYKILKQLLRQDPAKRLIKYQMRNQKNATGLINS